MSWGSFLIILTWAPGADIGAGPEILKKFYIVISKDNSEVPDFCCTLYDYTYRFTDSVV